MSDSDSDDSSTDGVGAILPIQQQDVRRIVSGQVISDMSSAVKELVDNALDAGASSINIRLFNQGLDVIEVSDDGSGVPKHSRPLLAMKHATSKIVTFDDLYKNILINGQIQPTQLGFRGEALFSLVQISQNLIVCTRTEQEEMAQQMQFNRDGYLDPTSVQDVARKVGTTVAVVKLFDKLPVRRADMMKRVKVQRAKLLRLIQAYAVLCVGVRFNLYDKSGPGYSKTNVLMSTSEKSKSIKETISSVFGSSFLSGLTRFRVDLSSIVEKYVKADDANDTATATATTSTNTSSNNTLDEKTLEQTKNLWRIEGMISNAPNSNQRSVATEIQFFSINGRPVDLPKVSKVIADVWRNFESIEISKKRAACMFGLYLPNSMFDVNVSPDKREVFFSCESEICDLIKEKLFRLWSSQTEGRFVANIVQKESLSADIKRSTIFSAIKENNATCESTANNEPTTNTQPSAKELYPSMDERPQSYDNDMNRRPRGRMKRRNAFVNDPETIGKYTTDEHAENIENDTSTINTTTCSTESSCSTFENTDSQSKTKNSCPNIANGNATVKRKEPSGDMDEMQSLQQKRIRQNEAIENRIWNQTKLNFMSAESVSQADEINKLKSLQGSSCSQIIAKSKTSNVKDVINVNKSAKSALAEDGQDSMSAASTTNNGVHHTSAPWTNEDITNSSLESQAMQKKSLHAVSHQVNHIPEVTKGTQLPQEASSRTNETTAYNNESYAGSRNANNTSTKASINTCVEEKVRSPQIANRKISIPIHQTLSDTPTHTNTESSSSKKGTKAIPDSMSGEIDSSSINLNGTSPSKPKDSNIIWEAFQNTSDVAKKAKSMYVEIMNRRKTLKEIQYSKSTSSRSDQTLDDTDLSNEDISNEKGRVVKLSKEDFLTMKVVGQFNLGFILALSDTGELWILDQHACDEQFNFERLCRETKIHEQKLLKPLPLELSPSEENCILSNMSIFEKNGFKFQYDEAKPPRHRLSLTALPHSGSGGDGRKAVQFGKEDVGALCALLGADGANSSTVAGSGTGADGGGAMGNNAVRRHLGTTAASSGGGRSSDNDTTTSAGAIIRLPKSIAMFASRACRSSVMIGDALTEQKMEEIIKRLNGVDQPWTCPHGRPTIRHIKDLLHDLIEDEKNSSRVVAGDFAALSQEEDDDDL